MLGASSALGARQLRGNSAASRGGKSLVNTFPFNAGGGAHNLHDHAHHPEEDRSAHLPAQALAAREQRQGAEAAPTGFSDVAGAAPGPDGKRCIDKVEMVEETEYDDVVQCDHSYDKRCHTTFVTNYESQQEEECEENFRKICFINYEQVTVDVSCVDGCCIKCTRRSLLTRRLRSVDSRW